MRLQQSLWMVLIGAIGLSLLVAISLPITGQEPAPNRRPTARGNEDKIRELERLRLQIDRLIKDVEGEAKPGAPEVRESAAEDVPALKLDRVSSYGGGFARSMSLGWEFETSAPIRVTELGIWDNDGKGLAVAAPVGIWDANGKVVVSAEVPQGTEGRLVDQFRYVKVKPVTLEAGQRYVIGALYTPQTKENTILGGANFSAAAPLRWIRSRRTNSSELALPEAEPRPSVVDELPGSFGPSFLMAHSEATGAVRNYYRTRMVQQPPKQQTIVVPEQPDGSHREDKILNVSLYALPNGKLTQILFNDTPLGAGEAGFTGLANEIQRLRRQPQADKPVLRLAAMPSVKLTDLQLAMGVTEHGHYNPRDTRRVVRGGEVGSIAAARMKQPQRSGEFVAGDRFKDAGDYIEDRWTGLLWQKDGASSGKRNYYEARDYAADLQLGGVRGWRVPKIEELATIYPATFSPFTNTKYNADKCCEGPIEFPSYWTSELDVSGKDYAYVFQWYADGGANNCYASKNFCYVRCVHDPLENAERE